MAKKHTILEVFIASPSDLADERQILEDVVSEFNVTWGDRNKVQLKLVKWETHSVPGFGQDAQAVVNSTIGDTYDIFLGIMWGRFGSPTNRAESGTEEEFNRAYSRLQKAPASVRIMFYFKNAPIRPSKICPKQLEKVQNFKKKIATEYGGLYHEFESTEDFRTKVRMHLSKVVQDWLDSNTASVESKAEAYVPRDDSKRHDPLSNLAALENETDEDGWLDLVERASDAMDEVVSIVQKMTAATNDLGVKFRKRIEEADELTASDNTPNVRAAKRILNNAAKDLNIFVQRLTVEIPAFYEQNSLAMETYGKIAMISGDDFPVDLEGMRTVLTQIQGYRGAIDESSNQLRTFRESISGLPRMTMDFNRARKRAVAIMDDLLAQLRIASNQSEDVEQLFDRLLGGDQGSAEESIDEPDG